MPTLQEICEKIPEILAENIEGPKPYSGIPPESIGNLDAIIVRLAASDTASFVEAFGRGLDRWSMDLIVMCGGDSSQAEKRLRGYIDGGGDTSIRKVLFLNKTLGDLVKSCVVAGVVSYGPREEAAYPHVAATLRVHVYYTPN